MLRITNRTLIVLMLASGWALGQAPEIGFVYPAGAKKGTTVRVVLGGQNLGGAESAYVSGKDVSAEVVHIFEPLRPAMSAYQGRQLAQRIGARKDVLEGRAPREIELVMEGAPVKLPDSYVFDSIDKKSLKELATLVKTYYIDKEKRQPNAQIGQNVTVDIKVSADAEPSMRELRLMGPDWVSNPIRFQIGTFNEINEQEPNGPDEENWTDPRVGGPLEPEPPVDLPIVLNGQIMPGDVDAWRFHAKKGQKLVLEAKARKLIPYLADAVPGWFQCVISLFDSKGNEVAYDDDFRFKPDPVLFFEVPADDVYTLHVYDAIYRGREDFVYRVEIGEQPFITSAYPLGGFANYPTEVKIDGWNLPRNELKLDTSSSEDPIREMPMDLGSALSNPVLYTISEIPEGYEKEPNSSAGEAQLFRIDPGGIINGRIDPVGDVDWYQINAGKGFTVVAEVFARRLDSPMDSLLTLYDSSGRAVAWNDDNMEKSGHLHLGEGLVTHHADSYMVARLPSSGDFFLKVEDAQKGGGPSYSYRLRFTPKVPDFELRTSPSAVNAIAGREIPVEVYVLRKDGFEGEVNVSLVEPGKGWTLSGGRIPPGRANIRMTLRPPADAPPEPVAIKMIGTARVGRQVTRAVVPADNMMQAFLWRHLVQAEEMLVSVKAPKGDQPALQISSLGASMAVPEKGTGRVVVQAQGVSEGMDFLLKDPPEGIAIASVEQSGEGMAVNFKLEGEKLKRGYEDNLIVEAFRINTWTNQETGKTGTRRVRLGYLPAIPIHVTRSIR